MKKTTETLSKRLQQNSTQSFKNRNLICSLQELTVFKHFRETIASVKQERQNT